MKLKEKVLEGKTKVQFDWGLFATIWLEVTVFNKLLDLDRDHWS